MPLSPFLLMPKHLFGNLFDLEQALLQSRSESLQIDLLRNTTYDSVNVFDSTNPQIILHRFAGETKSGIKFYVQVKQNKRTGRKDFMSVFPVKSHK